MPPASGSQHSHRPLMAAPRFVPLKAVKTIFVFSVAFLLEQLTEHQNHDRFEFLTPSNVFFLDVRGVFL